MEDKKVVGVWLILSSVGMMLLFGGWASFSESIPVGMTGLKLTSLQIAPYLLTAFWLFSWQRFYVLSRHNSKAVIDSLISDNINTNNNNQQNDIIRTVFPPAAYRLKKPVVVRRWAWPSKDLPEQAPANYVVYKRLFGKRLFMFNYMGNDLGDAALFVHIGLKSHNIHEGMVKIPSLSYWKCLFFEIKTLFRLAFEQPVIGAYYFPHLMALICFFLFLL